MIAFAPIPASAKPHGVLRACLVSVMCFIGTGCATAAMLDSTPTGCHNDCLRDRVLVGAGIDAGILAVGAVVGGIVAVAEDSSASGEPMGRASTEPGRANIDAEEEPADVRTRRDYPSWP